MNVSPIQCEDSIQLVREQIWRLQDDIARIKYALELRTAMLYSEHVFVRLHLYEYPIETPHDLCINFSG